MSIVIVMPQTLWRVYAEFTLATTACEYAVSSAR